MSVIDQKSGVCSLKEEKQINVELITANHFRHCTNNSWCCTSTKI